MTIAKKVLSLFKKNKDQIESEEIENLDDEGKGMVRGIVELSDTSVKEVMIPRIDTVFISEDEVNSNSFSKILDSNHSRFPVYRDTIDDVVGILYTKDLLSSLLLGKKLDIPTLLRPGYFVPESMKIDSLLKEMKQRRVHIAVAVDEYGGISGIISMEDILEEIVGDIQDEFDDEEEMFISLSENQWLCDARMNIEDFNQEIETDLPTENFDTLGGFVFDLFGKIPKPSEKKKWRDFIFVVQSVEGHTIRRVKIIRENAEE